MAKQAKWKCYRRNLTNVQARKVIKGLEAHGKVWGKTVTATNEGNKWHVWVRR